MSGGDTGEVIAFFDAVVDIILLFSLFPFPLFRSVSEAGFFIGGSCR